MKVHGSVIFMGTEIDNRLLCVKICAMKKFLQANIHDKGIVVLALPRTPELLCAILALLELEIPFLIIDISIPSERIDYMIENVAAKYTLTHSSVSYRFQTKMVLYADTQEVQISEKHCVYEVRDFAEKIAYILYTSGSTGKPKAVAVTQKGLYNFVESVPEIISLDAHNVICSFTNATFDIFMLESVLALYTGMKVVLASDEQKANPKGIKKLLMQSKANTLQITPSMLRLIESIDKDLSCLMGLEVLMIGGEKFPEDLLKKLQQVTNAKIFNMYGPTETTIWSTIADLTHAEGVTIGKPIANTEIYLLSEDSELVEQGKTGEICIAGDGLAEGYINNAEQTKKAFQYLKSKPNIRIYRTGDLGKINAAGELICMGRIDEQIKLFGRRIELDEIDVNIRELYLVDDCATCLDSNNQILITFYINQDYIEDSVFIKNLREKIPAYMIPNQFVLVPKFLYTSSGKLDRREMLKQYMKSRTISKENISQEDAVTTQILQIIEEQIGRKVSVDMLIEDLVITSFMFITIAVVIEDTLQVSFEDEQLIKNNYVSIRDLVDYVKEKIEEEM